MSSSGDRVFSDSAGSGDDVRATVASTGSCSRCIDASTLSFEYSCEAAFAKSTRVPPMTTTSEHGGDAGVRQERSATPMEVAGHGARDEQRHDQCVDGGHERPHPRVDHAGREKQLKRIGGNPEQVEQKRHRRSEAAEEGHEPGERQLGIVRERHRRVGEPSCEQDEAQGEQLPRVREIEGGRHDDFRQPARLLRRRD